MYLCGNLNLWLINALKTNHHLHINLIIKYKYEQPSSFDKFGLCMFCIWRCSNPIAMHQIRLFLHYLKQKQNLSVGC